MTFDFDKGAPTTFAPVVTQLDVPLLKALAKKYEKPITLYDLETSDFVHMPVFGITEVGGPVAVNIELEALGTTCITLAGKVDYG